MLLFWDRFVGLLSWIVVIKSRQQIEINEDSSDRYPLPPMLVPPLTVVPQPLLLHSTACEGPEGCIPCFSWLCCRVSLATAHQLGPFLDLTRFCS